MSTSTLRSTALVGGIAFTATWIAGLLVAPAGTDVTSTGAEVVAAIRPHAGATALQYVLTELVPAVVLAVTVGAVAAYAARVGTARADERLVATARLLRRTAIAAGGISAFQGTLGLALALVAVPRGADGAAVLLFETVNRADGVKMFVLAGMALLGLRLGRLGVLPTWLTPVATLLAVSVAVSGVGYLLLVTTLAAAAYVSLPLLLVWVTGSGLAAARRLGDGR
ncbi:hypothetical protein [Kineosporia sp. A_224]|uniref:hypothetical protein n=1 Tax=Kineosporia sp. A_224 TaxID=1962180 RepID=UPI000B4AF8B6|nr:hypothetical protein [Kineosporia sp. A_224]